ncbi:MAG: 2-isopropylmalate synthase [Firmicutes bacterium]|nr:2-isopropylmalate synthase [Bacillota bacterium]MBR2593302.1 2-isopropylmalate synthase [Bacillota bacterium]
MSDVIKIFDTTLRDGEQSPGCSMNLSEKIEMAKQLERLNVDIIEAGFAIASPGDFESVRTIAETVTNPTVASLSRTTKKDIQTAWDAVKYAKHPRIHTFIATSPLHMEYKLQMSPEAVLNAVAEHVRFASSLCDDVEFSAEDATRSEWDFLAKVTEVAIANGATTVNIPDTVGYTTPDEMYNLMRYLKEHVKGIDDITLSTHNHNDLGLAVANTIAAIRGGVTQVECTINGIGERAGNAALEEIVMALETRKDYFGFTTNIDKKQIYRSSKLLSRMIGVFPAPNKAIVGKNAFAHESGVHQHGVMANRGTYEIMTPESIGLNQNTMVLGKHSGRHAFAERLESLGIVLEPEQIDAAFAQFKILADKKKTVSDRDIEALVGSERGTIDETYELESFVVNSGTVIDGTATIVVKKDGEILKQTAMGEGQIEAAFAAINAICGMEPELMDYNIFSVSEGGDAQGEGTVKLKYNGYKATGTGVSVDIIEASIRAYLNGINKLIYAMNRNK